MGFWNKNSGYEFPLVLAAGAAALCETGPGAYSVDALVGLSVSAGLRLALLGLAVVGGLVPSRSRSPSPGKGPPQPEAGPGRAELRCLT